MVVLFGLASKASAEAPRPAAVVATTSESIRSKSPVVAEISVVTVASAKVVVAEAKVQIETTRPETRSHVDWLIDVYGSGNVDGLTDENRSGRNDSRGVVNIGDGCVDGTMALRFRRCRGSERCKPGQCGACGYHR